MVGGGLAGLAAALTLAEAGRRVVLYEAGPACGGRCRSYFDRALGCRIDNGNHLLLSGNQATMRYLERIGSRHTLAGPGRPEFPFIDLRSGARWRVRPNAGRLPWWLLRPGRGVPGARLRDYAALLRLRSAGADDTVAGVLPHNSLYELLLEPLAVSALNTPADQGSARLLWAVMAQSLARGGRHCIPCFPEQGLSESFVDPAVARLRALGAEIHTGRRIGQLRIEAGQVTGLAGPDGTVDLGGGGVVLAVPPPVATALLPGLQAPDAFESILNLHYRIDVAARDDVREAGFVGLVGGRAEWVFLKPGIVSVTISAASRYAENDAADLAGAVWPEVCAALGIAAALPPWRVIREKRATFTATPAQQRRRPSATTPLSNLALAGDWTDTGLPATIEGAIRSGFAAAHHLLARNNRVPVTN